MLLQTAYVRIWRIQHSLASILLLFGWHILDTLRWNVRNGETVRLFPMFVQQIQPLSAGKRVNSTEYPYICLCIGMLRCLCACETLCHFIQFSCFDVLDL